MAAECATVGRVIIVHSATYLLKRLCRLKNLKKEHYILHRMFPTLQLLIRRFIKQWGRWRFHFIQHEYLPFIVFDPLPFHVT